MNSRYKRRRLLFVGSISFISLIALFFVVSNFRNNIVFFYSPSELKDRNIAKKISGKKIRIGGLVKSGSVKKINVSSARFVITDLKEEVIVSYHGILPDLFRDKQGVVASGDYDPRRNEFFSEELLIKHDEKYMPPEVSNSLKK